MSEVTDALNDLIAGRKTMAQVEELFRTREWPDGMKMVTTAEEAWRGMEGDFGVDDPGAFAEVTTYYFANKITAEQYRLLELAYMGENSPTR